MVRIFPRVIDGETAFELRLRLLWTGKRRIVKLVCDSAKHPVLRIDAVPGGICKRPLNMDEYPVFGYTALVFADGSALAAVTPHVFGVDCSSGKSIGLTLLRSPFVSEHDPVPCDEERGFAVEGRGEHDYRIRFVYQSKFSPQSLETQLYRLGNGMYFSETTLGCGKTVNSGFERR